MARLMALGVVYKATEIKSDELLLVPELIEDLTDADGTGDLIY